MRLSSSARVRALLAALAIALAAAPPATASGFVAPRAPAPLEITAADVAASNAEVRMAYDALAAMWSEEFARVGERFAVPRLARYRTPVRTACGVMQPSNAVYCAADNGIYFDDVFVAAQGKRAALQLGTDGDMAAVGVIAHEMGHAVAMQLGHASRVTYENERLADCLTGAFARRAAEDGSLEAGDEQEAFYAMAAAADPTRVGDRRIGRRVRTGLTSPSHGTREQRMANFGRGLNGGPGACLPELR